MTEILPALSALALYSGLNGLIFIWLGFTVGKARTDLKIFIGDGGDPYMIRVMRGQLNFVENVPMTLGFLLITALLGAPAWVIHILGLLLTVGRVLHGLHFTKADAPGWQRMAGSLLTVLVQVLTIIGLIGHAVLGIF